MARRSRRFRDVDLYWREEGDLVATEGGDIADTSFDIRRALTQEVQAVLQANRGDWVSAPSMGASLEAFFGAVNGEGLATAVGTRIIESLVEYNILDLDQFVVVPTPIGEYLLIRLIIQSPRGEITLQFGFDSKNKQFIGYSDG